MNLIREAWIPVRRRDGTVERVAPWQITEGTDDCTITALAAPRPDFNGALIQFLIGLLQTTRAPDSRTQWQEWLVEPPGAEELKEAFEQVAFAFELDGDGPRFMQDLTIEKNTKKVNKPVYELLIEVPTGQTLRENKDHFVKRGGIDRLCYSCAAIALFTLQVNAPSGGQGHRTGLRGGGPVTTLILADTLWETCWLNVLEKRNFLNLANSDKAEDKDRFPWLAETHTSEDGTVTTPQDTHPDQIFWSMPRRIRLIFSTESHKEVCDLCGTICQNTVKFYFTKNLGINYTGSWSHSLSPYFIAEDGAPSAIHPQPGGIGYRHWLGLVQSAVDKKGRRRPALAVEQIVRWKPSNFDLRLWAFGYDMDNMKARCWYDSTMPLVLADDKIRETYEYYIGVFVKSAQLVADSTQKGLKNALFGPKSKVRGNLSFIKHRFWQETEPHFFTGLNRLRDALTNSEDVIPILDDWHKMLRRTAESIFNDISQTGEFDAADPKRIALAWRDLQRTINSKKLLGELGLR